MKILNAAALTLTKLAAAALFGVWIAWNAETVMAWEPANAAAAGYQGAILILAAGFATLAIVRG
jgi:hypothetical protein